MTLYEAIRSATNRSLAAEYVARIRNSPPSPNPFGSGRTTSDSARRLVDLFLVRTKAKVAPSMTFLVQAQPSAWLLALSLTKPRSLGSCQDADRLEAVTVT